MNYRLLILTADNGEEVYAEADVDTSQVVAVTYQAFDIADLEKSWAGGSNQIKLPKTPHNSRLFNFPDSPIGLLDKVKRFIPCVLEVDGIAICDSSSRLVVQRADAAWYYVEVLHGTFNLFSSLSQKRLRDMSLPTLRRDNIGVSGSWDNELAVIPLMDWHAEGDSSYNISVTDSDKTFNALGMIPFLKLKALANKIVEGEGYTLTTGVDFEDAYTSAAISLSGRAVAPPSYVPVSGYEQTTFGASVAATGGAVFYLHVIGNLLGDAEFVGGGQFFSSQVRVPVAVAGTYTLELSGKLGGAGSVRVFTSPGLINLFVCEGKFGEKMDIWLEANTEILLYPRTATEGTLMSGLKFTAKLSEVPFREKDSQFPIAANAPDMSQRDVLRLVGAMFGLIPQVDGVAKKLTMYNINDLYEKVEAGDYRDWSGKVTATQGMVEFHNPDYGQSNTLSFTESEETEYDSDGDSRDLVVSSTGGFALDDTTLQVESELFTLEPKAAEDRSCGGLMLMKARELRGGEPLTDTSEPRMASLSFVQETFTLKNVPVPTPANDTITTPRGLVARFNPLNAQRLADLGYSGLAKMLSNTGKVTEMLRLSPIDVANFDFSKPVYIEKYGAYFYVLKIANYRADKLTQVELLRL